MKYQCLACDYPNLSEPPRSEYGGGSFEICPACGFQFGVNDDDEGISYDKWRSDWEKKGMPWSSGAIKRPETWNPVSRAQAKTAAPAKKAAKSEKTTKAPSAVKKVAKKVTKKATS
jgi:hypothetical protein